MSTENIVSLLIDLMIEGLYSNSDFKIKMNEDTVEKITEKYDTALKSSGMAADDFGEDFFEQLKESYPSLATAIEDAVYVALQEGLQGEIAPEDMQEFYNAGLVGHFQDEGGDWYVAISGDLDLKINLTDWPRIY